MIPAFRHQSPSRKRRHENAPSAEAARAEASPAGSGFLLLHGWQNYRPPGHWLHWLAGDLADRNHQVLFPQLPEPDEPVLETWIATMRDALEALDGPQRTVVCHSLACMAWLHLAASSWSGLPVDRVVLVAPPGPAFLRQTKEVRGFSLRLREGAAFPIGARFGLLVCSNDDWYCKEGADVVYGGAPGLESELLPGQGHLDMEAGYGRWPGMLEWCLGTRNHITARDKNDPNAAPHRTSDPPSAEGA